MAGHDKGQVYSIFIQSYCYSECIIDVYNIIAS